MKEGDHIGWTGGDNNRFVSREDDDSFPPCRNCTRSLDLLDHSKVFRPLTVIGVLYMRIALSPRQFIFSAAVRINRRKSFVLLF